MTTSSDAVRWEDFDAFFADAYPPLVRSLAVVVGRWQVAEEVAQDAMLKAHRHWPTVAAYDRPDLWLRRVAMNAATSVARRTAVELRVLARLSGSSDVPGPEPRDDALWSTVARLPATQRTALVLSAVDGYTAAEIGRVLDCGEETARTHLRRARERAAEELRSIGEEAP